MMVAERRIHLHQAMMIDAAIRIESQWGCVGAWHYLLSRGVARETAARVLRKDGARRSGDAQHVAARDDAERAPETGIGQRLNANPGAHGDIAASRTNVAAAFAVERAIELSSTHGRHYAESLLRIYSLNTATVIRVLLEPHRRRRKK